jgi:acyl-CoA thioesterase-2
LVQSLRLRPDSDGRYRTTAPRGFAPRVFGGHLVAQAVAAAVHASGNDGWPHSAHAYFLRPVEAEVEQEIVVAPLRESRSFRTHEVRMTQHGQLALVMTVSQHHDEPGVDYQLPMPTTPGPDAGRGWEDGPVDWRGLSLPPPGPDGSYEATGRLWLRLLAELPDDVQLMAAAAAYVSDMTGTAARPLSRDDWDGYLDASLDHAIWFHRPLRVDDWVFFDLACVVNHGSRSLIRGSLYDGDGRLCLSMAQELLIRPVNR